MQAITSADTSRKQIAGFYKKALKSGIINSDSVIFDFGCGKYLNKLVDYATEKDFCVFGYDKYNQPIRHNLNALNNVLPLCNMIVCNNVLNVLQDSDLNEVLYELSDYSKTFQIPVYITVYDGNKSGIGKPSKKDCFQRNMKTIDYKQVLLQHFNKVTITNDIIKCEVTH